jgi:hypothetical protein
LRNVSEILMLLGKNMNEVKKKKEFGIPPPACITVAWLHDKFGADGTLQNVDKEH